MFVRVVRFTDASQQRIDALLARIEEQGGPPEDVPVIGVEVFHDSEQETAVVLQYFRTAEDMQEGATFFASMDSGDTPGARASVDMCELKLERHVE